MATINAALLTAIIKKTGLSKQAVYARIQQTATGDFLPRNLAAIKVGADEGLPINKFATSLELAELRQAGAPVLPPTSPTMNNSSRRSTSKTKEPPKVLKKKPKGIANQVFVVHGRDIQSKDAIFAFIRSLGIKPIEWTTAIAMSKKAAPYVGEILNAAFAQARAVVVILTPDDYAQLRPDLLSNSDPAYERKPTGQARANVLFECGMAFSSHPDRTVMVQIGNVRPFSDTYGRHIVHMNNDYTKRNELAIKLKNAGCDVDLTGTDWVRAGDFIDPETRPPAKRKKRQKA